MRHRVILLTLICLCCLVSCAKDEKPIPPDGDDASLAVLSEGMECSAGQAATTLAVLREYGCEGEVLFAYPAEDADGVTYYHIWIGDGTVDLYPDGVGGISRLSRRGVILLGADGNPPEPVEPVAGDPPESQAGELRLLAVSGSVPAGEMAHLDAQGVPGEMYRILVYYASGVSTAKGLEPQTADGDGALHWEWRVGNRTKAGEYRICVLPENETDESRGLQVNFTVTERAD